VNLAGSRNVFEAAVAAGAKRLVYASSVAAYGFHRDNPQPLTEETPRAAPTATTTRPRRPRSRRCCTDALDGTDTAAYVLRPASSPDRDAPLLIDSLPYTQLSERLPGRC
jgi:UDP-glucose 4-epimerase